MVPIRIGIGGAQHRQQDEGEDQGRDRHHRVDGAASSVSIQPPEIAAVKPRAQPITMASDVAVSAIIGDARRRRAGATADRVRDCRCRASAGTGRRPDLADQLGLAMRRQQGCEHGQRQTMSNDDDQPGKAGGSWPRRFIGLAQARIGENDQDVGQHVQPDIGGGEDQPAGLHDRDVPLGDGIDEIWPIPG